MASIAIVEDHSIVREGIRSFLQRRTAHDVVAETGDGLMALDIMEEHRPDVAIIDLRLPGLDGLEVVRRVRSRFPEVKVVVMSMHANPAFVTKALEFGASAYVLKHAAVDDLENAIEFALKDKQFVSEKIRHGDRPAEERKDPYDDLTPREREILQLVAEGLTAIDIADKLTISSRTVEKHRANMMKKLGVHNQAEVIRFALERGVVPFRLPGT